MNIPTKKPALVKTEEPATKKLRVFNAQGFGKAGNNAISILIAQGHFEQDKQDTTVIMHLYKELTKLIYNTDQELVEEIKNGK